MRGIRATTLFGYQCEFSEITACIVKAAIFPIPTFHFPSKKTLDKYTVVRKIGVIPMRQIQTGYEKGSKNGNGLAAILIGTMALQCSMNTGVEKSLTY